MIYQTNNFHLIDYIPPLLILLIINSIIIWKIYYSIFLLCSFFLFLFLIITILFLLKRIDFTEKEIVIRYFLHKKTKTFHYTELIKVSHITAYANTSRDILFFKQKNKIHKIKAKSIRSEKEYYQFQQWILKKIPKLTFFPDDRNYMGK